MLFYSQIKREFTNASWKRGQIYFREGRVTDVKLDGDTVSGKIQGTEPTPYETAITMARGTIFSSKCSCPAHRVYETHCKHVAALAIWIVERGSLLRAGVSSGRHGVAAGENLVVFRDAQKAADDPRLKKLLVSHPALAYIPFAIRREMMAASVQGKDLQGNSISVPITLFEAAALLEHTQSQQEAGKPEAIQGEAVLFIRGMFQSKIFSGLVVESAIRYIDPITRQLQIHALSYLTKQPQGGIWKTNQGLLLKVPVASEVADQEANFIQRLDTAKVIYQGPAGLENLAKFLTHKDRDQIVFDPAVQIPVESVPLRLSGLNIGGKTGDKARSLSYEYKNAFVTLSSDDLEQLAKAGKLSDHYAWVGERIYRLETSLTRLQQYTNRSGVAAAEGAETPKRPSGYNTISDDPEHPLHPLAAYRLSLELGVESLVVDPEWTEFHEWRKTFEKKKIAALPQIEYGFELRPYQMNGLSWLWSLYHRGLAALLADEMGLGKTHQVLALLSTLYRAKAKQNKPKQPSLVVAPTSVIAAWSQKLKKYDTGLKYHVFHGSSRVLPKSGVDVVLTTYGILYREPILRERDWHVVILDEAQAIKNASTISSRASRALKSKFRIAMTGTPIENQTTDLWSLMEFMLPGYLGSLPRFKRLYGWGRETPTDAQAQALKRLVSPFLLRRTKTKVLTELPEKTEEIVQCEMTAPQRKAYKECLNGAEAERARADLMAGKKIDYANILAVLTRLKQICDHPKLAALTQGKIKKLGSVDPAMSGKWETFEELINEALRSDLKIVVFTQYLSMIDLIGHHLEKQKVGYTELRGDTPDRGSRLEKFARDPECKVFLCSLLAGGLGIDLTSASVCIHYDRWWNPAKENQATDRLHRFGQTRGVQVFKLQIPNSVEDRIAQIIQSKTALSGSLIEESSAGLKSFSRKELLDLLQPGNWFDPDWSDSGGKTKDGDAEEDDEIGGEEEYTVHL